MTAADGASRGGLEDMRRGVNFRANRTSCFTMGYSRSRWRRPRPGPAIPAGPSPSSTKRWRPRIASAIAPSKRNCIGRAATCCSCATRPIRRRPRKRSSARPTLRVHKEPAASNCARRWRSPNSTSRRTARRRPRRPRPRPRRLSSGAGNAGGRRGGGVACVPGGDGGGQGGAGLRQLIGRNSDAHAVLVVARRLCACVPSPLREKARPE